jgi:anti-sigma B factor antagonist
MDALADQAGLAATCELLVDPSGTPMLKLRGELDLGSIEPVRPQFDAVIADRPTRVIIDLSELGFIDSSGLSLFLTLANEVAEVELRDPSAIIRRVVTLTGLSDVFTITP